MISTGGAESAGADTLGDFCRRLDLLREEAGLTKAYLAAHNDIPVGRARLFEILNGRIVAPPRWEIVRAIVGVCLAATHGQDSELRSELLNRWRREHARLWAARSRGGNGGIHPGKLPEQRIFTQEVVSDVDGRTRTVGVVTGDICDVRCAEVWVNSENTEMMMARFIDFSVSAVIRYLGARHDDLGRIVDDVIADELDAKVAGRRPVPAGSVIVTGSGELAVRNNVRYIAHAAAVSAEPGLGSRPISDIGRCVPAVMRRVEELKERDLTVLFPLLGTGGAGGDRREIAVRLVAAAREYLRFTTSAAVSGILFLAYSGLDLAACQTAFRTAGIGLGR